MKNLILFLYTLALTTQNLWFANGEINDTTFLPTHKWKIVKKGQPIPSGLHVRYNFQTGVTEAKLMSDEENSDNKNVNDESKENSLTLHSDATDKEEDEILTHSHVIDNSLKIPLEELKKKLKNIRNEDYDSNKIKNNFRSYDDLKKELESLALNITTDSVLLKNLFEEFKVYENLVVTEMLMKSQVDEILQILGDLEYLLHQVDNAQVFADMNGLAKIVSPCLNSTNNEVKLEALRVFGTAVQSNPKVQLKAVNSNFVQKLLHLLISGNNRLLLRSRCLFALGALIRQFPIAQKLFIDRGGLEIFAKILEEGDSHVQLRILNLVTDLAVERENIKHSEDLSLRERKIREYERTNFEKKLVTHNYCKSLSNIIKYNIKHSLTIDSTMEMYHFFEVALENMITLSPVCKYEFRNAENDLLKTINLMMDYYSMLNDTMDPENIEMYENIIKQITQLRISIFEDSHDEL